VSVEPLVHVVVVDYGGGALTLACLRSLVATDWPAERLRIVLVDNASPDPVTDRVRAELPDVHVITSPANRGFAGGSNLGIRERGDADFVALVNNDATVDPGWLAPLVETLADDPALGAACPKILLATGSVEVRLTTPTRPRGRGDGRALGVRVSGARSGDDDPDGDDRWPRTRLVEGFWGVEPMPAGEAGGQWTAADALLRVPVPGRHAPERVELRIAADGEVPVIATSGRRSTELTVGPQPTWYAIDVGAPVEDVINNVGTVLRPDGYGADRGWLEVDRGQYDEPADVDAWCGAAVLLRRAYLDEVGDFDESLFLYYEDIELSRRGAQHGWRYRTCPRSVVRHVHAASSGEGSAVKDHYNERNRLLVATRYEPLTRTSRLALRYLLATGSYARRDVVAPLLRREPADAEIVRRRLAAFAGFLRGAPSALRARRGARTTR